MIKPEIFNINLEHLSDLDWFESMCEILKSKVCPSTFELTKAIGFENLSISKENRGSKFLIPFDKRFKSSCINPDLADTDTNKPIDYLSFSGTDFKLKMTDVMQRFHDYRIQRNIYDGGTQIFFYPVAKSFEFTALSFHLREEPEDIDDINSIIFNHIRFHFGDNLILARDGFHMRR